MSNNQLRADLERRISDRLQQWRVDSARLYEMAELPGMHAFQDIYITLLGEVINLSLALDLPIEMVADSLVNVYSKIKAKREEYK